MKSLTVEDLKSCLGLLGRRYSILKLAYLHGSFVQGNPTPLSDVDIALVVAAESGQKGFWDFEMELEEKLERDFPDYDFDVRTMNSAPIDYQGKVITEGVLLYARDPLLRSNYEEKTRQLYFDFKPFIETYCYERLKIILEEGLTHG